MLNKYIWYSFGLVFLIFFRWTVFAIVADTDVSDSKYVGLFVNGHWSNGYSHLVISEPYFRFGNIELSSCSHLDERINGYLANHIEGWKGRTNFKYIFEIKNSGYRAYITSEEIVVYLAGFPDFGGATPDEAERRICKEV